MNERSAIFPAFAALSCALLLSGCGKVEETLDSVLGEPEDELARVGNSVLTLRDLDARFPEEFRELRTREGDLRAVRNWVDDEALAREARDLGLAASREHLLLVADFERKALADAMRRRVGGDSARLAAHLDSLKLLIPIAVHPERIPARAEGNGTAP